VRTGLFYLFESLGKKPVAQVYRDAEDEAVYAEEIGFAGIHPAEHHFSDHYGIMPRTELFLAKLAGRTRRIRLAPMVSVAPLTDPIRLAEDAALLDHLSDGRFTLSVGSGYRKYEFDAFGLDIAENRERTREALEIAKLAFENERLTFEGKHFNYKDVRVVPRPRQEPHMPMWLTTAAPPQVEWAASRGFGVLPAAGFAWPIIKADRERYVKAARQAGLDPRKHDAPCFKWIYVGETDAQARAVAEKAFMATFNAFFVGGEKLVDHLMARFKESGMPPVTDPSKLFDLLGSDELTVCVHGSPETVRQKLSPLRESGIDYFIGGFSIGALPTDEVRRSMRLYAERVMPHL